MTTEERTRGVHLTDKQIVFGVMTGSAVVVAAFLCGVFVGRGVQAARPAHADVPPLSAAVSPDPVTATDLDQGGASAMGDGKAAIPRDPLSYPERVTKPGLMPESLAPGSVTPPAPPDPQPDTAAEATGDLRAGPAASAPPTTSPAAGTPRTGPAVAGPAAGAGNLTVQVAAVRRKAEAQGIVDRLVKKGYPAFVYTPPSGDRAGGYRVRVGQFKSRAEAEAMAGRLKKEEQYKPWITR